MTYWVAVCQSDTNPGVRSSGPGVGSINCINPDGTNAAVAMEVQLMVVPPPDGGAGAADLGAVWAAGFGLVIICFLIARAVGVSIEFIRKG